MYFLLAGLPRGLHSIWPGGLGCTARGAGLHSIQQRWLCYILYGKEGLDLFCTERRARIYSVQQGGLGFILYRK